MNTIKKVLREKLKVTPSKDFDKKFWNKFEAEFDKESRGLSHWSLWGSGLAVAALVTLLVFVPQFSKNFSSKEGEALALVQNQKMLQQVTEDLVDVNAYIVEDLELEDLLDEDYQLADTDY